MKSRLDFLLRRVESKFLVLWVGDNALISSRRPEAKAVESVPQSKQNITKDVLWDVSLGYDQLQLFAHTLTDVPIAPG